MGALLRIGRWIVVLAVVGCLAMFAIVSVYDVAVIGQFVADLFRAVPAPKNVGGVVVAAFKILDLFLLAIIFYIVALGLSALFLDAEALLPSWFRVRNLRDLKLMIAETAVIVMAVSFLGYLLDGESGPGILYVGGGTALVIAALALVLRAPDH